MNIDNMPIRVLIIEDEPPAIKRLTALLNKVNPDLEIVDAIDSVDAAIKYLKRQPALDLIFMDIQLSDGLSFEIFESVTLNVPIVFTTAFDNYMIDAFKVHSVDYLLKPIEPEELEFAYNKFNNLYRAKNIALPDFSELLSSLNHKKYKERFIVKSAQGLRYIPLEEVAYFYSEDGYSHIRTLDRNKHIIDYKMDELESIVNPDQFFRINRKMIIGIGSLVTIDNYFNSRYKLKLNPTFSDEVIVSRERCAGFKNWLDR